MSETSKAIGRKQTIPAALRYTVLKFNREFPDDVACLAYIAAQKMPGGIAPCAKCGVDRKHHHVTGRTAFACDYCGNHVYPLKGTIFEKSATSLRLWFYAMYLMGSTRCGVSAKQIQREIGVTYKTAWRMFRQIRALLRENTELSGAAVEMDEAYYGGVRKAGNGRPLRGDKRKTPMVAIVERHGKVIAKAIRSTSGNSLLPLVREHVLPGSVIYTDEYSGYDGIRSIMGKDGNPAEYDHRRIKHTEGVYVRGDVHTNSVEGFWSLIKRGISGVYHSVGREYLQSYLDEYAFRFNRRDQGNLIFKAILEKACERA